MKKTHAAALLMAGMLGMTGAVNAAPTQTASQETVKTPLQQMHMGETTEKTRKAEIQADYFQHRGERRYINLYNLHVFRQYKEMHGMSLHWGLTVTRPVGSWAEKSAPTVRLDSGAVGVGHSYMVRWTKPLGQKWEVSLDVTGGLMVYNKVHPAHTRSYDFMWRIGPRLTYNFNDRNALSVAYLGHHVSNGQRTKNPGYNGVGVSIGYRYTY